MFPKCNLPIHLLHRKSDSLVSDNEKHQMLITSSKSSHFTLLFLLRVMNSHERFPFMKKDPDVHRSSY